MRFGVAERTASDRQHPAPVSDEELARLREAVQRARPESVAISLLLSFANPVNEHRVRKTCAPCPFRGRSTVLINAYLANAYLAPRMQHDLQWLAEALDA